MKVSLLTVCHRQPGWVVEGCTDYERRLPREWGFTVVEIKPAARTGNVSVDRVRATEAERLQAALPKSCRLVALDEHGQSWPTERFAERLAAWMREARDLAFVIGGPDGLDPTFLSRAETRLSLSPFTMPHGLVRIVMVEQLYRVATLLAGHPYHRS